MTTAKLELDGKTYEFPVIQGTEGEVGIDIAKLRGASGAITLDPALGNSGACQSAITFIDGDKGILHYRGYSIDQLVEKTTFEENIYLLLYGELPTSSQLAQFNERLAQHALLPEGIYALIESFPRGAHPMGVLQAATAALSSFAGDPLVDEDTDEHIVSLVAKYKALCAAIYRREFNLPRTYSTPGLSYAADFAQMAFSKPNSAYHVDEDVEEVLNKLLILHADHEQNCSTTTVRVVGSSHANIYASISAGVGALWGPRHGGANQAVLEQLELIRKDGADFAKYIALAKDKESGFKLMGFGHRVYKNFDPRAKLIKSSCDKVLNKLGIHDPLLGIAKELEKAALGDDYFVQRKLFPNVDFYSGIIYRALNIPTNMFTVMFALGRLPGWIAQWKELLAEGQRISRPRQIYTGQTMRDVPPLAARG